MEKKERKDSFIIVMPVYNEVECVESVIKSWVGLLKKYKGSNILVLNDGSTDETGKKLDNLKNEHEELIVIHKANGGHGDSVIKGYDFAVKSAHDWIFQVDSDDQFSIDDFHELWEARDRSNFILGHRFKRHDPFYRMLFTKLVRFFNFLIFGIFIKDANIPYRLMNKNYLNKLLKALPENVFAPNIFLSVLAAKDNQNLLNIPVIHKERNTGEISIPGFKFIKVSFRGLKELISFRLKLKSLQKQMRL